MPNKVTTVKHIFDDTFLDALAAPRAPPIQERVEILGLFGVDGRTLLRLEVGGQDVVLGERLRDRLALILHGEFELSLA